MKLKRLIQLCWLILSVNTPTRGQAYFYPQVGSLKITAVQFSPSLAGPLQSAANPALIPTEVASSAAICMDKRFMAKELLSVSAAALVSFKSGCFALSLEHFGGALYNEKRASLGLGKRVGDVTLGIKFSLLQARVQDVFRATAVGAALSATCQLTDQVFSAVMVNNPQYLLLRNDGEHFRPVSGIRLGIGFQPSKMLYVGMETEKEADMRAKIYFLASHRFNMRYSARLFWDTGSNQPYFGIKWHTGQLLLEAGSSYHVSLGISPCLTISYHQTREQ